MVSAHQHKMDEVATTPDKVGPVGRYWKGRNYAERHPDRFAIYYVVEAPYAHPLWHSYMFSMYDLVWRPGDTSLSIYLPGATHEFVVSAIHPSVVREGLINGDSKQMIMFTPPNFICQFIAESNEVAENRMLRSMQEVIDGQLSPDTDFRSSWVQRWNDSGINKS